MKRILTLIMAFCLFFTISACSDTTVHQIEPTDEPTSAPTSAPSAPTTEPTIRETTEPDTPPAIIYDFPMTAVSTVRRKETVLGKSDQVIFEYTYPTIAVMIPNDDISNKVNTDLLGRIEANRETAADLLIDAQSAEPRYPYSLTIQYDSKRIDSTVLSFFVTRSIFNGGSVHHSGHGLTYDLTTGKVLTLSDILLNSVTAEDICPLVVDALAALPEETYLFGDYVSTVESRFSGEFLEDESWHLSGEGLCFTFAPYEVAPNSSGYVHALIPYGQLSGILEDAWFPLERITPDSELNVAPFSPEDTAPDALHEIRLHSDGDPFLLTTNGLIYDLVIECGYSNGDGTYFTVESTVFRADSLVPGDGILLQADVTDPMHRLRITYTGADGLVSIYLS